MMKAMSMKYYYINLAFLFFFLHHCVNAKQDDGLGASFIFGDSLVDAGNNNYLSTLSKANIPPNGIDFKASGGSPTGRYTNGRTIGDLVGNNSLSHLILLTKPLTPFNALHTHMYIHTYTHIYFNMI